MDIGEKWLYVGMFFIILMLAQKDSRSVIEDYHFYGNCTEECSRLLKRDFFYCMVICFLIIVGLITWNFGGDNDVITHVSFAGTVSSIILSVMAIFMTIVSENKNAYNSTLILNTKNEIVETARSIDAAFKGNKELYENVKKYTDTFETQVKKMEEINSNIENFSNEIGNVVEQISQIKGSLEFLGKNIEEINEQLNRIEQDTSAIVRNENSDFEMSEGEKPEFFTVDDII